MLRGMPSSQEKKRKKGVPQSRASPVQPTKNEETKRRPPHNTNNYQGLKATREQKIKSSCHGGIDGEDSSGEWLS